MSDATLVSALRDFASQVRNFKNDPGRLVYIANEMDRAATAHDARYPNEPEPQEPEVVEEPEPKKEVRPTKKGKKLK
jgi:hypothetical protein